jgi:hypothetical protein
LRLWDFFSIYSFFFESGYKKQKQKRVNRK